MPDVTSEVDGDEFVEDGLPHVPMRRSYADAAEFVEGDPRIIDGAGLR